MSTLKTTNLQNPSASTPNIVLGTTGGVALNGVVTGSGMDHLLTWSFAAAPSVSVNNCFSSLYDNYRIVINSKSITTRQTLNGRFRASGVDDSQTGYYGAVSGMYAGGASYAVATPGVASAGNTTMQLGSQDTDERYSGSFDFHKPFKATQTTVSGTYVGADASNLMSVTVGYGMLTSLAYDGFTIYPSASTITGTVRVYGYHN